MKTDTMSMANGDLLNAACQGGAADVLAALEAGARADASNEDGMTALVVAVAQAGGAGCVKVLAAAGADVEARVAHGETALMWAALRLDAARVNALLEAGAAPSAKGEDGRGALDVCPKDSECWRMLMSEREARELEKVVGRRRPGARKAAL